MGEPKIATLAVQPLSKMLPYGALILCSSILGIVLISNCLERWILRKMYATTWEVLGQDKQDKRRRSFTYFHVGTLVMAALIIFGAYPVMYFLVCRNQLSEPLFRNSAISITIGDALFVLAHIYSAYYLFELCFRTSFASAISIAHHLGLLLVVHTSMALFSNLKRHPEAPLQFYMCMVWGMNSFEVPSI